MKSSDPERKVASIAPFGLRMQPELKQQIEEQARANGRSLNAEIVWRLEQSLASEADGQSWIKTAKAVSTKVPDPVERLDALEQQVRELMEAVKALQQSGQDRSGTAE